MIDRQQKFYQCQECSAIVEHIYQHGLCRNCLGKKLQTLRAVIDQHHTLRVAVPTRESQRAKK
ncbi:MAG: hypothetical protein N2Z22_08555 [Turneriella sp.]|nr:hypothetical protein [Turneriella sp.]